MMFPNIAALFVALIHVWFLILEMFLWTRPFGLKTFGMSAALANETASLAANQGLYNGFLAAGLIWGASHSDPVFSRQLEMFFLACVVVAGVYGGFTANPKIFFVQALPGLIAFAVVFFSR